MKENLIMTLIGRDRPGLVESVSAIIEEHDGLWEESRMVQLAGEFAGILRIEVPGARAGELEDALGELQDLSVVVSRVTKSEAEHADSHFLRLEVVGQDRPGIIHRIAAAVAGRGINVEELESSVESAAMSGEKLFRAEARLRAPKNLGLADVERDLEELANDLMVDVSLEEG